VIERRPVPGAAEGFEVEVITDGTELHYVLYRAGLAINHGPGLYPLQHEAVFGSPPDDDVLRRR
jgi:hypothetical protein